MGGGIVCDKGVDPGSDTSLKPWIAQQTSVAVNGVCHWKRPGLLTRPGFL